MDGLYKSSESKLGQTCRYVTVCWSVHQDFVARYNISIVYICASVHIYPEYTGKHWETAASGWIHSAEKRKMCFVFKIKVWNRTEGGGAGAVERE